MDIKIQFFFTLEVMLSGLLLTELPSLPTLSQMPFVLIQPARLGHQLLTLIAWKLNVKHSQQFRCTGFNVTHRRIPHRWLWPVANRPTVFAPPATIIFGITRKRRGAPHGASFRLANQSGYKKGRRQSKGPITRDFRCRFEMVFVYCSLRRPRLVVH